MKRLIPWLLGLALLLPATLPAVAGAEPTTRSGLGDEGELQRFDSFSQAAFKKTRASVDARLANLDDQANNLFDQGTEIAFASMTASIQERLAPYKNTLFGPPPEAEQIYAEGKQQFEQDMKALAVRVANVIADEVAGAKREIALAEANIAAEHAKLPAPLRARAAKRRADYAAKLAALANRAAAALR